MQNLQHELWCQQKGSPHTDAAKRFYEVYNLHYVARGPMECHGRWLAIALADGSSDGVLYDTKQECIRHQHHNEQWYAFVKMIPSMMKLCEAEVMITTYRKMYDAGMRMVDPDSRTGGMDLITRVTAEDQIALSKGRVRNLIIPRGLN